MKRSLHIFTNGLLKENPVFRLVLGMCSTIAVTTEAVNGIGMGLAATFVLVGSNVFVSALKKVTPDNVRIPVYVIVIATFTTIVQLLLKAFLPSIDKALGLFIPLIVVNCIILARAEAFASKNSVWASTLDGLGMGVGYTLAITLIGCIREILGNGTIFGMPLFGASFEPALIVIMAPGGFMTLGLVLAILNKFSKEKSA